MVRDDITKINLRRRDTSEGYDANPGGKKEKTMNQEPDNQSTEKKPRSMIGIGIAVGVALGVALGSAMDNIGAGIAVGIALGVAIGAGIDQQRKKSSS